MGVTIILEQIFAIPGLGQLMVNAIYQRDYPLIRGSVLLVAVTASVVNLLVDLIYAWIDPRGTAFLCVLFRTRKNPGQDGSSAEA